MLWQLVEGKYKVDNAEIVPNDNIVGAFKCEILQKFSYDSNTNNILIDKASILIYKKILRRYYFLSLWRKYYNMEDISASGFVFSKNEDYNIIKIGFEHFSIDRVPIDFTEWKIKEFTNIFSNITIKNILTDSVSTGKYNDKLSKFIYDIKLSKKKDIDNDVLGNKQLINKEIFSKKLEYNDFIEKIQNIFPCNNLKFINYSLENDFNHILDLEDSVSYFEKKKARKIVSDLFNNEEFLGKIKNKYIWIRINNLSSTESTKDIVEILSEKNVLSNITGIIIPKVSSEKDVKYFLQILRSIENNIKLSDSSFETGRLYIQLLIESSDGLYNLKEISKYNGIIALISGLYDYKDSIGSWDIFNQYPELLYQKKKIINICRKSNLISVESITPVLNFDMAFTESLLSYNINFITKWSVYPTHAEGSRYSKNLKLFLDDNHIENLKFLRKNLLILKKYRDNIYINQILTLIDNYFIIKNDDLLIDIRKLCDKIKNINNREIIYNSYNSNDKNDYYDLEILKNKYVNNESIIVDDSNDYRDLLDNINQLYLELDSKDLSIINNIDTYKCNLIIDNTISIDKNILKKFYKVILKI